MTNILGLWINMDHLGLAQNLSECSIKTAWTPGLDLAWIWVFVEFFFLSLFDMPWNLTNCASHSLIKSFVRTAAQLFHKELKVNLQLKSLKT